MNINEKDIFDFVWQPGKLDIEVYSTIENNYEDYKDLLDLIKSIWDDQYVKVSHEILAKIKLKIKKAEEGPQFDTEGYFEF